MAGVELSLEGKVALITGGSRGIGAATVRLFTAAGARVAFSYRVATDEARTLVDECGALAGEPGRCVAIQQELSTPKEGRTLVSKTVDAFGRLDCLVVNHGIWGAESAPIAKMSEAQWSRTMGVIWTASSGWCRRRSGRCSGRVAGLNRIPQDTTAHRCIAPRLGIALRRDTSC
ncbi:MAG TPA: SDR family NAD(P)-dependent oxidoreductase [Acidisarcina sp.]